MVIVLYFSGTGNTKWAVEALGEVLRRKGEEIAAYPIETLNDADLITLTGEISNAAHVGFAFPLYGANIPRMMRAFIKRFLDMTAGIPMRSNRIFFINTFGYVNGCGFFEASKHLKASPFRLTGYVNLRLTDHSPSFSAKKAKVYPPLDDRIKQKAVKRLQRFADACLNGRSYINGIGPHLLAGIVIRRVLKQALVDTYQKLVVDDGRCTRCMQCLNDCPTGSIADIGGSLVFSRTCEACMRCFYFCPAGAISLKRE